MGGLPGSRPLGAGVRARAGPAVGGLVIGISHEGGTAATNRALAPPGGRRRRADHGDHPLARCGARRGRRRPTSWTSAGATRSATLRRCRRAAVGSRLGPAAGPGERSSTLLADAGRCVAHGGDIAGARRCRHLLVLATGADRPAGRELVLKVEEATWLPSAFRDVETFLHGHLPATGERTGLVLILADRGREPHGWSALARRWRPRRAWAPDRGDRHGRRRRGHPHGPDARRAHGRPGGVRPAGPGRRTARHATRRSSYHGAPRRAPAARAPTSIRRDDPRYRGRGGRRE